MQLTDVVDTERLYRSVVQGQDYTIADGRMRVSSSAFWDRNCQPSVDRSSLRTDPAGCRLDPSQGVVQIFAREVRTLNPIRIAPNDKFNLETYAVDVAHRPVSELATQLTNWAHCQIECEPAITNTHFKKLKLALAVLAEAHGLIVAPD